MNPTSHLRLHSFPRQLNFIFTAGVAVAAFLIASSAVADDFDTETVSNATGSAQSQLNLVLAGNVAGDVDATLNPFASGSVTSSYNNGNNTTTFSFTGTAIPSFGSSTVGLSDTLADQLIGTYWGTASSSPSSSLELPTPTLSVNVSGSGGSTVYFVAYVNMLVPGGATMSQWFEEPVTTGDTLQFEIANNDIENHAMDNFGAGYVLSPTLIPLDDLNMSMEPPSGFAPFPDFPNGSAVNPGGNIKTGEFPAPEPQMSLMLVSGVLGFLAFYRGKKSQF